MNGIDVRKIWNIPAGYDAPLGDAAFVAGDFAAAASNARQYMKAVTGGNVAVLDDLAEMVARFAFLADAAAAAGLGEVATNARSWADGVAGFVAKHREEDAAR